MRFRKKTLGIAISSQPATARTPATTNEMPRNVTAASSPFPRPKIGNFEAPAAYSPASNPVATTTPKNELNGTIWRDTRIWIRQYAPNNPKVSNNDPTAILDGTRK